MNECELVNFHKIENNNSSSTYQHLAHHSTLHLLHLVTIAVYNLRL